MIKYVVYICAMAYTLSAGEIAIVKMLKGQASASMDAKVINLSIGSVLDEKMIIQTKNNSSATIVFNDSSVLVLGGNSIVNLKKYIFEPKRKSYEFKLVLKKGSATFESGDIGKLSPESFTFETPQGTVSIRGTKFAVKVD